MFIVFELKIEGLDILHISDDISTVVNHFTDGVDNSYVSERFNHFSAKNLLESNGVYFRGKEYAIDMNYDNSNCRDTFDNYSDMYKLIKPYHRDIKLSEIV